MVNSTGYCQRCYNMWIAVFCYCRRYRIQLGLPSVVPQLTLLLPHHSRFVLIPISWSYCVCAVHLYMACDIFWSTASSSNCAFIFPSSRLAAILSICLAVIRVTLVAKWVQQLLDALHFKWNTVVWHTKSISWVEGF